jgi:hypothetical protein
MVKYYNGVVVVYSCNGLSGGMASRGKEVRRKEMKKRGEGSCKNWEKWGSFPRWFLGIFSIFEKEVKTKKEKEGI